MKPILFTLFVFIWTTSQSQNTTFGDYSRYSEIDTHQIELIESFKLDFDHDGLLDSFEILILNDLIGDPEVYSEINIMLANQKTFTLKDIQGYFRDTSVKILADIVFQNQYVTVIQVAKGRTAIIFNGYSYPSCSYQHVIASISENGILNVSVLNIENVVISTASNYEIAIKGTKPCTTEAVDFTHTTN